VNWIGLAQDREKWRALVDAVMNLRVLLNAGKLSRGYTIGGLSSSAQRHRVSYAVHCSLSKLHLTLHDVSDNEHSFIIIKKMESYSTGPIREFWN
jgi:hypothetical protein